MATLGGGWILGARYYPCTLTFLDKFNPKQFEILNSNDLRLNDLVPFKKHGLIKDKDGSINGKAKYIRIVIKNKS